MAFSDKALALIIDFEGINQPGKWPGAASGITLGYGYDLGHVTRDQFAADWGGCFDAAQMTRLGACIGKTGEPAKALAPSVADIRCTRQDSQRILVSRTLPDYLERTRAAFPGFDGLPLEAQGALVSLVYNRGASMKDAPGTDNRREMRAIRDHVAAGDLAGIAKELRSMKRLWAGKGLDGLLRRREAEAALVESCITAETVSFGLPTVRRRPVRRAAPAHARKPGQKRPKTGGAKTATKAKRAAPKRAPAKRKSKAKAHAASRGAKRPAAKKRATAKAAPRKTPVKRARPRRR